MPACPALFSRRSDVPQTYPQAARCAIFDRFTADL